MHTQPRKLILHLLLFSVPFVILISVLMYLAYREAIEIVAKQFTDLKINLSSQIADNIEDRFHLLERELTNLKDHLEESQLNAEQYNSLVHRHTLKYSDLYDADILISNRYGAIYFYRKKDPLQQLTHIPPELFRRIQLSSEDRIYTYINPVENSILDQKPRIFFAMPLFDPQHHFGGVIAFSIRAERLLSDILDAHIAHTTVGLLDPDFRLLYPFTDTAKLLANEIAHYDSSCFVKTAGENGERVCVDEYVNADGIKKIAICQRVKLPGATWLLTLSTPKTAVTQSIMPFVKRFRFALAFIHLFVYGNLFLAIYYTYRWNRQLENTNQRLEKEVEQRKRAEENIKHQNDFFEKVIESIPHPFYVIDTKTFQIKLANSAVWKGRLKPEPICYKFLHGNDAPCNNEECICPIHVLDTGENHAVVEHVHRDAEGNLQYLEVHGYPVYNEKGELSEMIVYAQDVTRRRKAEKKVEQALKEKEVLISEIHHRVKNNLQVMYGLLEIQSDLEETKNFHDILKNLQHQIMAMALVHEKLYQGDDLGNIDVKEYFERLLDVLLMSYGASNGQIELEIAVESVKLSVDTAILCGLIMNELVSNCFKHAFPDGRKGKVRISLHPIEGNRFVLEVSDNGVGLPEDLEFENTDSFGLQMVQMLIEGRISGTMECIRENGTTFRITFRDPALASQQTQKISQPVNSPTKTG